MHHLQANWFPTYTLGEDMALALEVQKAGWKGAYVKASTRITCVMWLASACTAAGELRLLHLQEDLHEQPQAGTAGANGSR